MRRRYAKYSGSPGSDLSGAGVRLVQQTRGGRPRRGARAEIAHDGGHAGVAGHGHCVAQRHVASAGLGDKARAQAVAGKVPVQTGQPRPVLNDGGDRLAAERAAQ
ncbi:hypothetical protein G6F31_021304 [Rhizopus arrhizus]|nr:hypothetical protein G6F31_021304 [Rhizopus arrhizus]